MPSATTASRVLAVGGAILVAAGLYLPWQVVPSSHTGPLVTLFVTGMETGYAEVDAVLVAATVLVAGLLFVRPSRPAALLSLLAGLGFAVMAFQYPASVVSAYVAAAGMWLTGGGGALLAVAGSAFLLAD